MKNENEQIAKWKAFSQAWLDVWAAFGLNAPNDQNRQTLFAWGKVQHIPAAAWPFIADRVGDMKMRPQNMGKAFKDAYSEWIERNEPNAAKKEGGRKAEGPIGQRLTQLSKSNPGVPIRELLGMAIREVG